MPSHLLSLASLFVVCVATCVIPGPNNFMLMRLGMRRGRGAALAAGFGTLLSCIVWCAAAALGLAAVLAAAPWLYKALRIGGGLYLLWFAYALWRTPPASAEEAADTATGRGGYVWQGFAINMTNPKSVLFFASIFSAYVGPDTPLWVHAAAVAIVCLTCLGWQVAMAWLFSARRAAAAYGRAQRPLDLAAALLMGAFGVSLIWLE
ncbi:MAG: putative lysine exporter protein [Phenylobacterium sp.]|nr:putative lysine exporter protein [Phenylobacterium sp.]